MAKSTKFYGDWAQHNGKVVTIDGIKYRLRCEVYVQRYPYMDEVISVHAEPLSKTTRHYRETWELLRDHWSIDVLASDIEVTAAVLRQVS